MSNEAFRKVLVGMAMASVTLAWQASAQAEPKTKAATAEACFPSCRSGYTCHAGACVSLCNPGCGAGEQCLANGECVAKTEQNASMAPSATASAPSSAVATSAAVVDPAPVPAASGPAPADTATPSATPVESLRGKWVAGLRLGTPMLDSSSYNQRCTSNLTGVCAGISDTYDFSDRSPLVIGVDGLVHATSKLRFGASYWLIPYTGWRTEGSDDTFHLGNAHRLLAVAEGLIPLGSTSKLALRAQAGLALLMAGGDLEDVEDERLAICRSTVGADCETERSPLLGSSYGVQVGYVMGSKLRWRTDLAVERFSQTISERRLVLGTDALKLEETTSATRLILSVGMEL